MDRLALGLTMLLAPPSPTGNALLASTLVDSWSSCFSLSKRGPTEPFPSHNADNPKARGWFFLCHERGAIILGHGKLEQRTVSLAAYFS